MKKLLSAITTLYALSGPAVFADGEFDFMNSEAIGPLEIGTSREAVFTQLKSKPKLGRIEKWDADGSFHQQIDFPAEGIQISLTSATKAGPQTVESVTASSPCAFNSKQGIHVGSTVAEVTNAYRADWNKEESQPGETFVAGSVYGGLIISFKAGKVSQMFLGAAGE